MRNDHLGNQIVSENDLCEIYYKDPTTILKSALTEKTINFDDILELDNVPKIQVYTDNNQTLTEFDSQNQNNWFMPKEYFEMDIAEYVLSKCVSQEELQRAGQELLLFQERNMFTLLKYLKYLVDVMRENNIVWGVGRGSSVASFVLFLIGIHRINSLYFDLPIEEFLK